MAFDFGDSWSGSNSQSPLLRLGVGMDPLAAIFPGLGDWKINTGDKLQGWVSKHIAKNDPFIKLERQYGPSHWFSELRPVSDWALNKPLDTTGLVIGGIYGAGALGGLGGAGGAGAGSAGAGIGAGAGTAGAAGSAAIPTVTVTGSTGGGLGSLIGAGAAGGAAAGNAGLWDQGFRGTQGFSGSPYGSTDAVQNIPGLINESGAIGGGGSSAAGMGATDYAKLGLRLANSGQQQQQQSQVAAMPQNPTLSQRINAGLGRIGNTVFPVNPQVAANVDPAYLQNLQNSALLKLGLGMAAAARQPGANFMGSLGSGLGLASNDLEGALQTAYQNARQARAERRADTREDREMQREDRLDARQQWLEDHSLEREKVADQRWQTERDFRKQQAEEAQKRWQAEQAATAQWRSDQLGARTAGAVPSGYRLKADGSGLEPIPGGPADPSVGKGKITDAERLTAAYAQRMQTAADKIDALNYVPSATELSAFNTLIGEPGIKQSLANRWLSPEAKQYFQALQDFSRAKLRKESGAVIGKDEITGDLATFFPLPGDDATTIAQKKAARATALQGMIQAAGPAYLAMQGGYGGGLGAPDSAPPARPTPAPGVVEEGYRFKGGDPSNPASWERVQ